MKLLFVIPNGVGVRDFLTQSFTKLLVEDNDVIVLHPIPIELATESYLPKLEGVSYQPLIMDPSGGRPSKFRAFIYHTLRFAHMRWGNTKGMRVTIARGLKGSFYGKTMLAFSRFISRFFANKPAINFLEQMHSHLCKELPSVLIYKHLLETNGIDAVLTSTQRFEPSVYPIYAANALGLRTATFVSSWDNLTTKPRITPTFSQFFVWNELMARELLKFHPNVSANQVSITGAPQFIHYKNKELIVSREEFLTGLGFSPSLRLICYSGAMQGISSEDVDHVRLLLQLIKNEDIQDCQVAVRPSPFESYDRYLSLENEFVNVRVARPDWIDTKRKMARFLPTKKDKMSLANLAFHSDLNINIASTMTIDFALHDKPVINLAFGFSDRHTTLYEDYYGFEHYQRVVKSGAVRIARNSQELISYCNMYLTNPTKDSSQRAKLVEEILGSPTQSTERSITKTINEKLRIHPVLTTT